MNLISILEVEKLISLTFIDRIHFLNKDPISYVISNYCFRTTSKNDI